MKVRVLAFARVREILGASESELALASGAQISDVWGALVAQAPALAALKGSTRIACNGRIVADDRALHEGDEIALLPPSGGG